VDEWYYTKNNQQMGPVSWDELKQLAASAVLKPSDMVWKEGLVNWIKAEKREGLFETRKKVPARAPEDDDDRPRRRPARDDDEADEDDRPRRRRDEDEDDEDDRPRRRRVAASTGMPMGAKVAIIGGSIAVGLLVVIVIMVLIFGRGSAPPGSYTVNLAPMQKHMATFTFRSGHNFNIRVTSNVTHPATDVDLWIERLNGQRVAADTLVSKDCNVNFQVGATEQLRVNVVNLGPGNATCVVNVN
jgi:hypothetical protein